MKARSPLLAASVSLCLGVLAAAQQTSVTPLRDTPFIHPTLRGDAWKPLPKTPPAPPPLVKPSWTKLPGMQQAPPPVVQKGEASNYCLSALNSSGYAAQMDAEGSLNVCFNDTCLHAYGCPPGTFGFFIYGSQEAQIPFGNGYLCISPFDGGLFRLSPSVAVALRGMAEYDLNLERLPAAGAILPGSTWNFQYWFRDPLAGGAGSNFSDGLRITFGP